MPVHRHRGLPSADQPRSTSRFRRTTAGSGSPSWAA